MFREYLDEERVGRLGAAEAGKRAFLTRLGFDFNYITAKNQEGGLLTFEDNL
jgi:hypothetical protein